MKTPTLEADERRKLLIATIFEKGSFEEAELIEELKRKTGGLASIGIGESIRSFLQELIDLGLLRYEGHRYSTQVLQER